MENGFGEGWCVSGGAVERREVFGLVVFLAQNSTEQNPPDSFSTFGQKTTFCTGVEFYHRKIKKGWGYGQRRADTAFVQCVLGKQSLVLPSLVFFSPFLGDFARFVRVLKNQLQFFRRRITKLSERAAGRWT